MDVPADSIGQLQGKVLEAAELMLNGLGLAQRDAAAVRFGRHPELPPLSAADPAAWQAQRAAQQETRAAHARALVLACRDADLLAQALPEGRPAAGADELLALHEELVAAERAAGTALARAGRLVQRLREEEGAALRTLLLKRPREEGNE